MIVPQQKSCSEKIDLVVLLRKSFISSNEEAIIMFQYSASRRNPHAGLEKPSLYLLI